MLLGVSDEADKKDELTSFIDSRRFSCIVIAAAEVADATDADPDACDLTAGAANFVVVAADVADTRVVTTSSLDSWCSSCCCCQGWEKAMIHHFEEDFR